MWNSSTSMNGAAANRRRVAEQQHQQQEAARAPLRAGGARPSAGGTMGGPRVSAGHMPRSNSSLNRGPAAGAMPGQRPSSLAGTAPRTSRRAAPVPQDMDDCNPVVAFLGESDMLQYAEVLLENGFDDLETLMEIEDADLADLGMPRGHILKLRRRLREFVGAAPGAQPPRFQAPAMSEEVRPPTTARVMQPTSAMTSSVQQSWEQVKALGPDSVGGVLYRNLFEIAPEVKELFPREVRARYQHWTVDEASGDGDVMDSPALAHLFGKVVLAVGNSIAGLHQTESLIPRLKQLGMRHVGYRGVTEAHFPVLLKALIKTLRTCLGNLFTPEVEFAWSMVYNFISAIMIQGLKEAQEIEAKAKQQGSAPQAALMAPEPAKQELTMGREICKGKVITGGLEPYLIEQHLQKAIFGDVYAATGVNSGRKFALKALDMDLVQGFNTLRKQQDHQFCESPLGEVQYKEMMRGLDHVVQLQDHFSDSHYHFVVSELASGGDLLDALRLRPSGFPEQQARWLIRGAAVGLASLHLRGLAMQDVSVENMLLYVRDEKWHVEVCDPGQAVAFVTNPITGEEDKVPFRGFVGKDFRPPELYKQEDYLATKVDSWCLGWSAFYLLVAQPLFHTAEDSAMDPDWLMFRRGQIMELFEEKGWSGELSDEGRDFILSLMQMQPSQRMSIKEALQHPWLVEDGIALPTAIRSSRVSSESQASEPELLHPEEDLPSGTACEAGGVTRNSQPSPPTLLHGLAKSGEAFVRSHFAKDAPSHLR